jgi:hypothetical protein
LATNPLLSVVKLFDVPPIVDRVDYYGISLLAGQTITVRLITEGFGHVGVFDPETENTTNSGVDTSGRLIATDYNRLDVALTPTEQISAASLPDHGNGAGRLSHRRGVIW